MINKFDRTEAPRILTKLKEYLINNPLKQYSHLIDYLRSIDKTEITDIFDFIDRNNKDGVLDAPLAILNEEDIRDLS